MVVTTTGSTIQGLAQGLSKHLVGNVASNIGGVPEIVYTTGTPDAVVTSPLASGVAFDAANSEYYMATVTGGSTWVQLVQ